MKLRISAHQKGKLPLQLDEIVSGYNREFLLYWVDAIIETANQLYTEDAARNNNSSKQQTRSDDDNNAHSLQKPIHLVTPIRSITGNSRLEIEVPDAKGYQCVKEAVSRHIMHMPLTVRELFMNISHVSTTTAGA